MPINQKRIIHLGYPYLQKKIFLYSKIKKEDRLIVVSQPHNSRDLSDFAIKINKKFKDRIIVEFKPHPLEYSLNPDYFKNLLEAGVLISNKNQDLYESFAKSRWQVGVCSTALYEGLVFGCACFILKSSGWEHMKKLIDLKLAKTISSANELDFNHSVDHQKVKKIFCFPKKRNLNSILNLNLK